MCTGIKIDYNGGSVMGRTMDYAHPVDYNVLYFPRNYNFCDDLEGQKLYSKYKTLGVCFNNKDPLKDGINEHGLMGITNDFLSFNLYYDQIDPEKKNISSLDYFTYALTHYKTVAELIDDLENIRISTKDYQGNKVLSPEFHFMFTDPSQRCIVVEPKNKELVYYENPYQVMTNSPGFETHLKRLKKHFDLDSLAEFNSAKNLPGGYDPFSRFIKAFYLTKMNVEAETGKEAFSHFYNIMNAMTMPEGFVGGREDKKTLYTRYICGYDTQSRLLTVKAHTNPAVYQLGFEDLKDQDQRQEFYLDLDFKAEKLS